MTVTFQSTCHHYTIGAILKTPQYIEHVKLAGAGQFDYLDGGRIFQTHRTGQVCCSVGTIMAAESDDFGFEVVGHVIT
jgi:hypothetical protein